MNVLKQASIPPEDEALRPQVRAFLRERVASMPAESRARSWMGFDSEFSRALGQRGWLGLTIPTEYGGGGRGPFSRFVVAEELLRAGAPVSAHWIADRQSGPLILKYGSEKQKRQYLPGICQGELFFCIGMSEPNAGSDLASVKTSAKPAAGGWLLNGAKLWTTNAHRSHYMIALVRTSGTPESRHAGLSQVIVDLSLPGITIRPIRDLTGDEHFCEVFFDNVVLGDDAVLGEEGQGWEQVTAELAFERSGPERIYSSVVLLEEWVRHLRSKPQLSEREETLAGQLVGQLHVLREMTVSLASLLQQGESPVVEAAMVKDMGTEFEQQLPMLLADLLASEQADGAPVPESLLRVLAYTTQMSPSFSLRGGTREILRGMIARGLGMR